ncbi:Uma2 family endonuclease [Streptomyces sp. NPDC002851]
MAVMEHEVVERKMTLVDAAEYLWDALPGHRVEILQGSLTVTPPADGTHALSLTCLMDALKAGAQEAGLRRVQGIGVSLPTRPGDYALPDLSLVDEDFRDARTASGCYAPNVFRLVVEVTSPSNWAVDLYAKAECYAVAGIPVYVVVDRKHDRVVVLTDPEGEEYRARSTYKRGSVVPFPDSIGISLKMSVDVLLDGE